MNICKKLWIFFFCERYEENISKNLSSKYSQKLLCQAKQSVIEVLETPSKRAIQKAAEATGDLIANKIADKIARISRIKRNT